MSSTIVLVDDHTLFRRGLASIIRDFPNVAHVEEASNGEALQKLMAQPPDLILMDVEMPGTNGLALTEQIKATHPEVKIIIISMHDEDEYIINAIRSGADGYLLKDAEPNELQEALVSVLNGRIYATEYVTRALRNELLHPIDSQTDGVELTEEETQLLRLICAEKSNKEIAQELSRSVRTVEKHRLQLLRKTGARNGVGLALFALRQGLVAL
ncbi:DNA-binding response regulator, NarL/FixJ family, contains REC and HTH domains [Catalinimonas alkaloidigena]|uniref:DNA-binding response regulator, NarL/FixJ family, contains REC and HTH domains n=1 Tax=Catalinimonas alkaloidigena TaxID=1075417 RepID=A0A1G9PIS0_9BACT|nr:response regulator transcription factor [Catalinimonas alkaloidigena]SDL98752.1 DNA-binding response regulator, NarL/FixJ family, contains REC and HTH domains [Catalinimonas alkaloidigena]